MVFEPCFVLNLVRLGGETWSVCHTSLLTASCFCKVVRSNDDQKSEIADPFIQAKNTLRL